MGTAPAIRFLALLLLVMQPVLAWPAQNGADGDQPESPGQLAVTADDLMSLDFKAFGGKNMAVRGGARAFADKLVSVKRGGGITERKSIDPISALGTPDSFHENDGGHYTLGCKGELVLMFTDNLITEQDGPELIFFEVGDATESALVQVSEDGINWINCGATSGGIESMDISGHVPRGSVFGYLKITDLGDKCMGTLPGADIDAVAALLSLPRPPPKPAETAAEPEKPADAEPAKQERLLLPGKVLFDPGKTQLKEEALAIITELAGEIAARGDYQVTVEGHSDSTGQAKTNERISLKRAESVAKALKATGLLEKYSIKAQGLGSSAPTGDNGTAEGRAQNRRVEIVLTRPPRE